MKLDLSPLKERAFRRIWIAEIVNIAGDWLGLIALTTLVYQRTESALATGLLFIAMRFLPALVGPVLVARFESYSTRRSLPTIYFFEAVMFALLSFQQDDFLLVLLAGLVFLDGSLSFSGRTLIRSSTAAILKPIGKLQAGNSLLNMAFTFGWAIFPLLAGIVVAEIGVQNALLLDAVTFLIGAAVLFNLAELPGKGGQDSWASHLKEGFSYTLNHTTVRALLIAAGVVVATTDIVYPVEVILVQDTLASDASGYGLFLAMWGVGMALGGLWFTLKQPQRLPLVLLISIVMIGIAYAATAVMPDLATATAVQVIGGVGNGFQVVAFFTLMQSMIDDHFQARVVSLVNTVLEFMPGVGFVIGGVLGYFTSPRFVFMVAGLGTLLVSLLLFLTMRNLNWSQP